MVIAASFKGSLNLLKNINQEQLNGTRVSLNKGQIWTILKGKNFQIKNINDGRYILQIQSIKFIFQSVIIQVNNGILKAQKLHPGMKKIIDGDPSQLSLINKFTYFQNEQTLVQWAISMLSNWYVLMMVLSLGLMMCYKSLMPALQEAQQSQQNQQVNK